jgi:diketogulonate reductase-like aldo/keto reductase
VQITGFSPLGSSSYVSLGMDGGEGVGVLSNPVVQELASKYGKTPAQVVLR